MLATVQERRVSLLSGEEVWPDVNVVFILQTCGERDSAEEKGPSRQEACRGRITQTLEIKGQKADMWIGGLES